MIVLSPGEEKKQAEEPQKIQATKMTKVKTLRLEVAETYHPNEFSAPSREYGKRRKAIPEMVSAKAQQK